MHLGQNKLRQKLLLSKQCLFYIISVKTNVQEPSPSLINSFSSKINQEYDAIWMASVLVVQTRSQEMLAGSLPSAFQRHPRKKHLAKKQVEKRYAMGIMDITQSNSYIHPCGNQQNKARPSFQSTTSLKCLEHLYQDIFSYLILCLLELNMSFASRNAFPRQTEKITVSSVTGNRKTAPFCYRWEKRLYCGRNRRKANPLGY